MTVERTAILSSYIGDGSGSTLFPFGFKVFSASHLKVQLVSPSGEASTVDPSSYKTGGLGLSAGLSTGDITLQIYDAWVNGTYRATSAGKKDGAMSGC